MRSKKNDLRTSRKSGAAEVGQSSRVSSKSVRTLRSVPKSDSRIIRRKTGSTARNRSTVKESSSRLGSNSATDPVSPLAVTNTGDNEYRRRRVDTTEYIKRRFLYDVAEAPRRLQRKAKSQRSTAALMAASSAKLSQRKSRHSDVKTNKNFATRTSRLHRENENHIESSTAPSASKSRISNPTSFNRKLKRSSVHLAAFKQSIHSHSSWDFPDIFECHSPTRSDLTENGDSDYGISGISHNRKPTAGRYPNALPRELYGGLEKRMATSRSRQSSNQSFKKSKESDPANKTSYSKKPEAFIAQSFFSADRSPKESPYPDDIISFCPNRTNRRNGKPKHSDMDFTDGFSTSSHSPVLSDRQSQPPVEDLEEELLAPELSILTATTCLASADGSLFPTFPQASGLLTGAGGTVGSSRRKSPVRPMQVLRTKAPAVTNTTSTVTFGCSRDLNSPSNQLLKNGRRTNIDDRTDDGLPVSYQSIEVEPTNIDLCLTGSQGFQSASVLRLTTPSMNNKATSITIRPAHDRSNKTDDKPGSVTDDSDKIPGSGLTHGSKSNRSGKAVLAKSLLLAHNATASRRRPSILRRSSGTPKAEPDEENQKPVGRTIGAFTPRSSNPRRSGKTSSESAGPTKLLQLITATSLASSTLTASEKLFGRRSGPQKQSLVTNATMPVTESRYVDSVKTPVTTSNSCRYAVLRGSANGKRYIVLGNNAIFDRSRCAKKNITPTVAPPAHTSVETSVTDSHSSVDVHHPPDLSMQGSLMDDSRESLGRFVGHSVDFESDSSQPLTTLDIPDSDPVSALIAT